MPLVTGAVGVVTMARRGTRALLLPVVLAASQCADSSERDPVGRVRERQCQAASDCEDGNRCNGVRVCNPNAQNSDANGCFALYRACGNTQTCSSDLKGCLSSCGESSDADGDGRAAINCGGDDCDDNDPDRHPGAVEVCDAEGRDEDCNPQTLGEDRDGDGDAPTTCANYADDARRLSGTDCDDTDALKSGTTLERCDGKDNDCDATLDDDAAAQCTAVEGMEASCASGECSYACRDGYVNCDGVAENGCEARLSTDEANCGACGQRCVTQRCVDAACVSPYAWHVFPSANSFSTSAGQPPDPAGHVLHTDHAGNVLVSVDAQSHAYDTVCGTARRERTFLAEYSESGTLRWCAPNAWLVGHDESQHAILWEEYEGPTGPPLPAKARVIDGAGATIREIDFDVRPGYPRGGGQLGFLGSGQLTAPVPFAGTTLLPGGYVFAFDPNGALRWANPVPSSVSLTSQVETDDLGNGYYSRVSGDGVRELVSLTTTGAHRYSASGALRLAAVSSDGQVLFRSNERFVALRANGEVAWSIPYEFFTDRVDGSTGPAVLGGRLSWRTGTFDSRGLVHLVGIATGQPNLADGELGAQLVGAAVEGKMSVVIVSLKGKQVQWVGWIVVDVRDFIQPSLSITSTPGGSIVVGFIPVSPLTIGNTQIEAVGWNTQPLLVALKP